jgi:thymidylate synthase (FAD)
MQLIYSSLEILTNLDRESILKSIELAGRTCYKSEDKITSDSATYFAKMICKKGHGAVLEFGPDITVRFIIDRGVSHELVRHRLCSFAQESTRYCNYAKQGHVIFIIPPWVNLGPGEYTKLPTKLSESENIWFNSLLAAEKAYLELLQHNWLPQAARSVLPNSLKTEIVVKANIREWHHILELRCSKQAHPQMRGVMLPILNILKINLPEIFGDIEYD